MDHVAKVTNAEWVRSGTTVSLTRTPRKVAEMQQQERQSRVQLFAEAIADELDSELAKMSWDVDTVRKLVAAERKRREELLGQIQNSGGAGGSIMIRSSGGADALNPALLAAYSILRQTPPSVLAGVLPGERIVLSNRPTQMQGALPFRPEPIMEQFRTAHNLLASVADSGGGVDPSVSIRGSLDLEAKPINGPLSKVLVIVQRMSGRDPGVSVEVRFADGEGRIVGESQLWLGPDMATDQAGAESRLGRVTLTGLSADLAKAMTHENSNQNSRTMMIALDGDFVGFGESGLLPKTMPAVIKAILDTPAANEPLQYFVSETIHGLAKAKGKQVMAVVPDQLLAQLLPMTKTGEVGLDEFVRQSKVMGVEIVDSGDVMLVSPANPAEAARTHVNRPQLQRLIEAAYAKRFASLADLSGYATVMPAQFDDRNLDMTLLNAINPMVARSLDGGPTQRQFLRLYGTLSPAQRLDNQAETLVPFGNLRPDQRQVVHQIVFGPTGMTMIGRGGKSMAIAMTRESGPGTRAEEPVPSLADEPTEVMPNGIPATGILKLGRRVLEGLFGLLTGEGFGKFVSPGELGLNRGIAQSDIGRSGDMKSPEFTRFQLADIMRIEASVQAGSFIKMATLSDGMIRPGSQPVSFENLPESIRAAVQRAADQAATMKFNFGSGPQKPPAS